ncbi:MAG TPA: permease, partial [Isosphaeraceae bacterium]
FLILGPAFTTARGRGLDPEAAARHAWFVGIAMGMAAGLFKLACAPVSGWVRREVPRAGLLGSLAAIALVIISFLPLLEVAAQPVAGLAALAVILATLTARWELPGRIPGALGAIVVGCLVYYGLHALGLGPGLGAERPHEALRVALPLPAADWGRWFLVSWREALGYVPVALPLALATVVGGIDCTESAAAAGDEYPTGTIIAVEGFSTLVGALFGGVIQSTPYIGHPAYKAMGARAGYTLATALFVGAAGMLGFFDWIFYLLPRAVVFPILIFVGLEIAAQSFGATPRRHYPALALACVPALAYLVLVPLNQVLADAGKPIGAFAPPVRHLVQTIRMLSSGFILTSLLWATALARLIDGQVRAAAGVFALAGCLALFGAIHSGLPSSPILWPGEAIRRLEAEGRLGASSAQTPYHWAGAYLGVAGVLLAIGRFGRAPAGAWKDGPGAD